MTPAAHRREWGIMYFWLPAWSTSIGPPTSSNDYNNEESPLLRVQSDDTPQKPTPFPTTQISIVILPWMGEGIVFSSLCTYINQLVGDLPIVGGDERRVGYYTGIIMSLHFIATAVTAFHWSRLSGHIGRKQLSRSGGRCHAPKEEMHPCLVPLSELRTQQNKTISDKSL